MIFSKEIDCPDCGEQLNIFPPIDGRTYYFVRCKSKFLMYSHEVRRDLVGEIYFTYGGNRYFYDGFKHTIQKITGNDFSIYKPCESPKEFCDAVKQIHEDLIFQ